MVIVILSVAMILVTILMSVVLINFRMKNTNLNAQKNFYTAEMALEEIRLGVMADFSEAASTAYADTLQKYGDLEGTERSENFKAIMLTQLKEKMQYQEDGTYSIAYLNSLILEKKYDEENKIGAVVTSDGNYFHITQEGVTLKNIQVTCYGEQDYVSSIMTDISLTYPDIQFLNDAQLPEFAQYALVATKQFDLEPGKSCEITGNAYLGSDTVDLKQSNLDIKASDYGEEQGIVICGGDFRESASSKVFVTDMELWANNLVVDSSAFEAQDAALYLKNDLILSNSLLSSSKVNLAGAFYGFGNIKTAAMADSVMGNMEKQADIYNNPADYSSSVIINGVRSSLDLSKLSVMKISGNSYIDGKVYGSDEAEDIMMGESLSIRSNQIAYFVPAECVAPGLKSGGTNPMPISQYSALLEELRENYGEDAAAHMVDFQYPTTNYGATLEELGVSDYQIAAQQVSGIGSMVYLFMKFDSVEDANNFFRTYYNTQSGAKLGEILDLYTNGGVKLPKEVEDETSNAQFFFQGNVLASGDAKLYVPDSLSAITQEEKAQLEAEEMIYQDNYEALNIKLLKGYDTLTEQEKGQNIYNNLVKNMVSADNINYTIGAGNHRIFVRDSGEAAVVANGDFVVNTENLASLSQYENGKAFLIIASGDITVEQDFEGLLLAGGTIHVKNNVKLTANADGVRRAFVAADLNGVYAYEYLVNGEQYISSTDIGAISNVAGGRIALGDYVVYENWRKQ